MSHIFLSYSSEDKWAMRLVATYLRHERFDVWVDEKLDVTERGWRKDIESAIRESACTIVLMSPSSNSSKWVEAELVAAATFERPIIPVLVEGNEIESVPFQLRPLQRFDISKEYQHGLKEIVVQVSRYTQRLPDKQRNGIDWKKVGSIFWMGSDSRLLRSILVPQNYNAEQIREQFFQVYHHAQRLNLPPLDLKRIHKLIQTTKEYTDEDWTYDRRAETESELRSIFRALAREAENADEGFDSGPKWKNPI